MIYYAKKRYSIICIRICDLDVIFADVYANAGFKAERFGISSEDQ